VSNFYDRWDRELQPALSEVQLLTGKDVAKLADRTTWKLRDLNVLIDRDAELGVISKQAIEVRQLINTTRNAMRNELGVPEQIEMNWRDFRVAAP